MMNYFEAYYKRYTDFRSTLKIQGELTDDSQLSNIRVEDFKALNNLIMSGLGMGTLYLRMGAVLMISEITNNSEQEEDIAFLKIVAEKLFHKKPADGEWKDIWDAYLKRQASGPWTELLQVSLIKNVHEKFVSFRNDVVHQKIMIKAQISQKEFALIKEGIDILDAMSAFGNVFTGSSIVENEEYVYFKFKEGKEVLVSPYVQINKEKHIEPIGILPYLFQGKFHKGSKFINTEGGETKEEKDEAIDEVFETIKRNIARYNGDKAFNFDDKIKNYSDWCIGRDSEVKAILEWINNPYIDKTVLPIFAPAGIGKGALVSEVIIESKKHKSRCLYHFCGSGQHNNLQAILYHFILQGQNFWNKKSLSALMQRRLDKLPSQYVDVIELFQALIFAENEVSVEEITAAQNEVNANKKFKSLYNILIKLTKNDVSSQTMELVNQFSELAKKLLSSNFPKEFYYYLYDIHVNLLKNNIVFELFEQIPKEYHRSNFDPLTIIIDGLDEAAVADHTRRISDWFYIYEDGQRTERKWCPPSHIKWIFTYRQSNDTKTSGYQFEYNEFDTFVLQDVQPLNGLSIDAVKKALKDTFHDNHLELTEEFIDTIIKKGEVK